MVYNPKEGSFGEENFETRAIKGQSTSKQLEHLTSVFEEVAPEEVFEAPEETPLVKEFRANKAAVMKELRDLVLKDPAMEAFIKTGSLDDLSKTAGVSNRNKRKWALFLKYADVWDDDLKYLGYLELKKIYALVKYND